MSITTGIASRIISTLGSSSSLAPIVVKDSVVSASLTSYSYKAGGKVEAIDRATDEFGTEAIWIGGIPFFKKLIDLTAYKFAKINPDVDVRIFADKDYADWALRNAGDALMGKESKGKIATTVTKVVEKIIGKKPEQTVKSAIEDSMAKLSKTKSLYAAKVIAATVLTLISYFALTKTRQKMTKERVEQEITLKQKDKLQKSNQEFLAKVENKNPVFNAVFKSNYKNKPSFKGIAHGLVNGVLFNPVHNMKLIDAGITTERLTESRNKTELAEYSIKEGFFLFFIYGSGYFIQKGFDKIAQKIFKRPINLDIKALMSKELKEALSSNKIVEDIANMKAKIPAALTKKQMKDLSKVEQAAYNKDRLMKTLDFIVSDKENIVVKTAKHSEVISTVGGELDTSKFISIKDFDSITENLEKIDSYFKKSTAPIEKFLKKTKVLKAASVLSNLAICCFVLGFVVPEVMYKYREKKTGSKKFHVAEDIKKDQEVKA